MVMTLTEIIEKGINPASPFKSLHFTHFKINNYKKIIQGQSHKTELVPNEEVYICTSVKYYISEISHGCMNNKTISNQQLCMK